ncbi:MAG: extracellular solute-binding protein [Clostridia bacterium]|nr:extracellular solute-binding protein [Clostridia bacterium]
MKRHISLCLLAAMLTGILASCGDAATPSDTTASGENDTTTAVETALVDTLPTVDYGGVDFNILLPLEHTYEYAEEQTGEIVDDAEYNRDRAVEEKYNVKINYIAEAGAWAAKDTFNGLIKQSVMAGDGAYDLVDGMIAVTMTVAPEGLFLNYLDLDGINLDDPWWAADMDENLSVSGKLFGICGSGLLSMYKSSYIMYYNEKLVEEYKLESPMQLVLDGSWTVDKFLALTKDMTIDLNSDGKFDTSDQFGYIFKDTPQRGFQTALGLNPLSKDKDGKLVFSGLTEKFSNAADKLVGILSDRNETYMLSENYELTPMFINNQALFYNETILTVENLRDMESDFGMIPQPKLDEEQESYHVQMGTGSGMYFIPKTANNPEMTLNVLNAYNCISMTDVVPAYYEFALKEKFTRSEDNKAVIDIINSSIMMDVTFAFASTIGGGLNDLFGNATIRARAAASMFESSKSTIEAGIAKLEETFAGLD